MRIAVLIYGRLDNFVEHHDNILNSIGSENSVDFFLSSDNSPNIDRFVELYKPIMYINNKIEHNFNFSKYDEKIAGETSLSNMTCHFINKYRVFCLLEHYIKVQDVKYDVILSLRIDLNIEDKFDFRDIEENTIYIPLGEDHRGGLNDQLAYGNLDVMKKYSCIIFNATRLLEERLSILHPESLVKANIVSNNINVKRFQLRYNINKNR